MKHVSLKELWGMVNRIDSKEKCNIAESFIMECDLSNDDADELLEAVAYQYREINRIEREKYTKPYVL